MIQDCKFDNKRDLQVHVPELHIDLSKAIETGTIMPPMGVEEFNHLDIDTVEYGTRLREPFDALENGASLHSFSTQFESGTGNVGPTVSTPQTEGSAD